MNSFIDTNFETDDDGNPKLEWDSNKLLLGGKGFSAKMLEAPDSTPGIGRLLNILFWLICQASETPEFAMGVALSSSKASVSEQLPIAAGKAQRKQSDLEKSLKELIRIYLCIAFNYNYDDDNFTFKIDWKPIIEKDMKLNIEIAKMLLEQGVITGKTAAVLTGVDNIMEKNEAELAQEEAKKKNEAMNIYPAENGRANEEINNIEDSKE
jgi:hypothetical protein